MTSENTPKGVSFAPLEKTLERILSPFEDFIHRQSTGGIVLMLATLLALLLANSNLAATYHAVLQIPVSIGVGEWGLSKPVLLWVNDGLMALFFFVVGLELKRELFFGELASVRKAALPIVAAIGGMLLPALIYFAFNTAGGVPLHGWAIPMATDIAFAIGVLVLLGPRVPRALMALLVAIAIIDDLGSILVIAMFYSEKLAWTPLLWAAVITAGMIVLNRAGVRKTIPYFCLAMLLWYALLKSGIHPTLAGVIGAFCLPALPKYDPDYFSRKSRALIDQFERSYQQDRLIVRNEEMRSIVYTLEKSLSKVSTPSQRLEQFWHLPVAYLVLPVFAFCNAGISISTDTLTQMISSPVFQGAFVGLLVGKFIGIFGVSWLAVRSGLLQLPDGVRFAHVAGMSLIAGIGFTMSIFISSLAFAHTPELLALAKTGVFAASVLAGLSGYVTLRYFTLPPRDIRN